VVIIRRGKGKFKRTLPDGLAPLAEHNLVTFKSRHEALTPFAMKELLQHDVAYPKLVSPSPTDLLPEDRFRLYAVTAHFPHTLARLVPWRRVQEGVYDCTWAVDTVRVVVANQLPREKHNAPLHLFSDSAELLEYAGREYERRSPDASGVLGELFEGLRREGFTMSFTMEDFRREFIRKHFQELTPEEIADVLQTLPPEELADLLRSVPLEKRLAGLSEDQIRQYLEQLTAGRPSRLPKRRRKK
jgi:hypothetical protein